MIPWWIWPALLTFAAIALPVAFGFYCERDEKRRNRERQEWLKGNDRARVLEAELRSAETLVESQKKLIDALQAKMVTFNDLVEAVRKKTPSNVRHLPVYRTAAVVAEPDKVYCKDCIWHEKYAFDSTTSCAKGPQAESPIVGVYLQRRSGREANATFNCPDFEKGDPFEKASLEKRRQAGVR